MTWMKTLCALIMNLDAFYLMTAQGAKLSKVKPWQVILSCCLFGLCQILALYIGQGGTQYLLSGVAITSASQDLARRVSGLIIMILGILLLWRSSHETHIQEVAVEDLNVKTIVHEAALTSIDALLFGIALALQRINVETLFLHVFIFSMIAVVGGIYYGRHNGHEGLNKILSLAGVLCILLGVMVY